MKIYTRKGDDGTTGLLYGGRVLKDSALPTAYGAVDEAQAFIGMARAETDDAELDAILIGLERDLWVLMADLATDAANRSKLTPGTSLVTQEMIDALEARIDATESQFEMPKEFVVPGGNRVAAAMDVARTVVRRAERDAIRAGAGDEGSLAVAYLNRLSDLLWMLARWQEGDSLRTRTAGQE